MFTLRSMTNQDAHLIYTWANDPVTRANSFQSDPIPWEQHLAWFNAKCQNPNAIYLIGEWDKTPCALIRFDVASDFALVGINLSPDFRGKGLSKQALHAACAFYFQTMRKPIHASIKSTNTASIHLFESVGFSLLATRHEQNNTIFDYKLEHHD